MPRSVKIAFVLAVLMALCTPLGAKTNRDFTYGINQLWNTAVRFIRVDMGFTVLEKDKKAGYLLFEYKDTFRACNASLEFVPIVRENRALTSVKLNIPAMPTYVETVLFDKFLGKLREEYGDPPSARLVDSSAADSQETKGKDTKDSSAAKDESGKKDGGNAQSEDDGEEKSEPEDGDEKAGEE
jgi:hypothetical protein